MALLLAIACAAVGTGCGGTTAGSATAHGSASALPLDAPAQSTPVAPAPLFALRDSLGHHVALADYRGRAVLLTFIYDHCPDTCPLIVAKLHSALAMLASRAHEVQVIAVSVDPHGDTPASVRAFLAAHQMTGRMEYLIGGVAQLAPVWRDYGIQVQGAPGGREVGHSALVYGITASGKLLALYPANFRPAWIAHDVPLLADS